MTNTHSRQGRRLAILAAASTAALVAATPFTFEIASPGGKATVRASLVGLAFAQSADAVTLENVTFSFGPATYRIPRLEVMGASLSRADLLALFDKNASGQLPARLAGLNIKRAATPELVIEQDVGGGKQIATYRNVVMADIVQGRVGSATSEGGTFKATGGKTGPSSGTVGRMAIENFDLAASAALYTESPAEPGAMRPVYGSVAIEALSFTDNKGVEVRMARMAGKDFRARPIKGTWAEAWRLMSAEADLNNLPAPERGRALTAVADVLGAVQVGSMEMTGLEVRDPKNKDQVTGRVARIAYTGTAGGQPADARAEGIDVTAKDGRARITTIALTGFDFTPTVQALRTIGEKPLDSLDPAELRKFAPTIGTVRFSGLDFDVPNSSADKPQGKAEKGVAKAERVKFTLKDVEATADKPVNGIPTNIRLAVQNLAFAVPQGTKESGFKELSEMGYKTADFSFVTAASWNEPGSELVVREVSLAGTDMATVTLRGVLGSISKDVFNADSAVALVALVNATARNAELTVENKGLFERLVANEAKKQKRSPEELRREYGMGAAIAVPAVLGNSASAKAIGQAVARFVAKPGRLVVTARAKDAAGLGVTDLMMLGEPSAVLEKLDVTAVAE
ncbi:MAG TPA: hypothetical protein VIL65_07770 [Beijerinckiaceae bacterium]|jgi:hypothetical protein